MNYKPNKDNVAVCNIPGGVMDRIVVCAAVKFGDLIIAGARHYDSVMHTQLRVIPKEFKRPQDGVQGFIDQWGNFMTRSEAGHVVAKNGQKVRNPDYKRNRLFSEDLY